MKCGYLCLSAHPMAVLIQLWLESTPPWGRLVPKSPVFCGFLIWHECCEVSWCPRLRHRFIGAHLSIEIIAACLLSMGVIMTSVSLWNLSGMSVREIPFLRPRLPDPSEKRII